MSKDRYNPALAFISNGGKKEETTPAPAAEHKTPAIQRGSSVPDDIGDNIELKTRRFQALLKESVFDALDQYAKSHHISKNEALHLFITTDRHV